MKIDYKKHWGNCGTVYSQTITIDKKTMEDYNNYISDLKTKVDLEFLKKHSYSEQDLKIKSIDYLEKGVNFTNLIHLQLFIEFYNKNIRKDYFDKDIKRVLWRNTIIKVVE